MEFFIKKDLLIFFYPNNNMFAINLDVIDFLYVTRDYNLIAKTKNSKDAAIIAIFTKEEAKEFLEIFQNTLDLIY
jgi:hypothetical protein